jgi:hypothetical protein
MFEKLYNKLIPVAQIRYILPGIILILLFNFFIFPQARQRLLDNNTLSGHLLDAKFSYGVEEAYDLMDNYGPEARTLYWKMALVVDNPYAVVYSIALMLLLILVFSALAVKSRFIRQLVFFPILAGIADIFENASLAYLLTSFPVRHEAVMQFASLCTSLKWIFLSVSLILLVIVTITYFTTRTTR